jgi:hypothetical protein
VCPLHKICTISSRIFLIVVITVAQTDAILDPEKGGKGDHRHGNGACDPLFPEDGQIKKAYEGRFKVKVGLQPEEGNKPWGRDQAGRW